MLRKLAMLSVILGAVTIAGFTSTRHDTVDLSSRIEASPDSYPVFVIRDEFGRKNSTVQVGETIQMCALARNIYTNQVVILIPMDVTDAEEQVIGQKCEAARLKYAEELQQKSA